MASRKGGLGKGLEALFADNSAEENGKAVELSIDEISPNRDQPRKEFDIASLQELSDSISQHGVLQPILVRPIINGGYQLVAGERRWRASMMAGLTTIPAVIREMTDNEAMEYALIENLQRQDLNPIEEAEGIKQLMDTYNMTHEDVAKRLNKSREAITNALRLLKLPDKAREYVLEGKLSSSHARTLLSFEDEKQLNDMADEAVKMGYSVRALEKKAKEAKSQKKNQNIIKQEVNNDTIKPDKPKICTEIEIQLGEILGRRVRVNIGKYKGTMEIDFYSEDDLIKLVKSIADW